SPRLSSRISGANGSRNASCRFQWFFRARRGSSTPALRRGRFFVPEQWPESGRSNQISICRKNSRDSHFSTKPPGQKLNLQNFSRKRQRGRRGRNGRNIGQDRSHCRDKRRRIGERRHSV